MIEPQYWPNPLGGDPRFIAYCPATELDDQIRFIEERLNEAYPEYEVAAFTRQVVPGLRSEGGRVYVLWGNYQ